MSDRLAVTSDFVSSTGDPLPHLAMIAEAGFGSVHWCHHWNTDFIYTAPEIRAIRDCLARLKLSVNDLHASHGNEKVWYSATEYQRLAGVDLVLNRLQMASELQCPVAILHLPEYNSAIHADPAPAMENVRKSLDALVPHIERLGVRIAVENMPRDNWPLVERVLQEYPPHAVGLCYDSGHGTISGNGLERLEANRHRLIALHLHDNDGVGDLHWLPFEGRTDWPRLARIIAASSYDRPVMTMESNMKCPPHKGADARNWLTKAAHAAEKLGGILDAAKAVG